MIRLQQLELTAHLRRMLSSNNSDLNLVVPHEAIRFKILEL